MRNHRREIILIAGRQRRLGPDGNGSDATVRVALGPPAREIEKFRRLLGIGAFECFGIREKSARERLCRGRQRPAEKLAPSERADSQQLARTQPAHELRLLRTAGHERINQVVRVEMNHGARSGKPLPPCIRRRIFPRRRTFRRQPHLLLQLPEHLEGFRRCHRRRVRIHPAADFPPLRRRQLRDSGFDFSERAHGRKMPGAVGGVNAIVRPDDPRRETHDLSPQRRHFTTRKPESALLDIRVRICGGNNPQR